MDPPGPSRRLETREPAISHRDPRTLFPSEALPEPPTRHRAQISQIQGVPFPRAGGGSATAESQSKFASPRSPAIRDVQGMFTDMVKLPGCRG